MTGIIESARVLLPVAITLVAPFLIWLNRADQNRREAVSFIAGGLTFISVLCLAPQVLAGNIWKYTLFDIMPGITVTFCADGLSLIFGLVASFLWMFATSYNIGYMRTLNEHAQTRYYVCFAVAIFGRFGLGRSVAAHIKVLAGL